jgi:hypothetical protein
VLGSPILLRPLQLIIVPNDFCQLVRQVIFTSA